MDDYISREAAIMVAMDYDGQGNAQDASQDIASGLVELPPADVQPVVYCVDCKWYNPANSGWLCEFKNGLICPGEDDFCSFGERREGGTP